MIHSCCSCSQIVSGISKASHTPACFCSRAVSPRCTTCFWRRLSHSYHRFHVVVQTAATPASHRILVASLLPESLYLIPGNIPLLIPASNNHGLKRTSDGIIADTRTQNMVNKIFRHMCICVHVVCRKRLKSRVKRYIVTVWCVCLERLPDLEGKVLLSSLDNKKWMYVKENDRRSTREEREEERDARHKSKSYSFSSSDLNQSPTNC